MDHHGYAVAKLTLARLRYALARITVLRTRAYLKGYLALGSIPTLTRPLNLIQSCSI